jgi:hypothetical protein
LAEAWTGRPAGLSIDHHVVVLVQHVEGARARRLGPRRAAQHQLVAGVDGHRRARPAPVDAGELGGDDLLDAGARQPGDDAHQVVIEALPAWSSVTVSRRSTIRG